MKRIVHFTAVVALAIAFVPASKASAAILPATAATLAAAMEVPAGDLTGVSINGSDPAGTGVGNSALGGFPTATPSFAILATGQAESADDVDGNNGEVLSSGNPADDVSWTLAGLNNSDGFDLVQLRLELDVPSDRNCATIDFKFLSEEWPDYYLSNFNDTFLAQLNPTGVPGFTITGNNVSAAPGNFAFDAANQVLSVNSGLGLDPLNTNPNTGTTYDGATATLSASTPVVPGTAIVIQFSVMDLGDNILDSAVFIDNFRWGAANTAAECEPGARINEVPVVDAGDDTTGVEGSAISLDGDLTDADVGQTVTAGWTYTAGPGVDAGATCTFADPSAVDTTITCTDDGIYTVTLTGDDGVAPPVTDTADVTVSNADPTLAISSPADGSLYPVGTPVTVIGGYADAGSNDTHTCAMDWDPGSSPGGTIVASNCSASQTFTTPGVYTITMTVTDDDGGFVSDSVMIVVYDPSAGFVTGGGRINSPAGAYPADPSLEGTASFGFVSKYKKGSVTPTGQTEFQFQAADFNFHSEVYQWLVVAGCKAQYKGTGTVNGVTGYGFLLTATDGKLCGGGPDRLRMKVWSIAGNVVVYDNKIGSPDDIDAAAPEIIAQGSIVIHK